VADTLYTAYREADLRVPKGPAWNFCGPFVLGVPVVFERRDAPLRAGQPCH